MGVPIIFSGNDAKSLKSQLDLNGQDEILSGTLDPSSVATSATAGSLYLNTSSGILYRKTDNGSSTNWVDSNGQVPPTYGVVSKSADYTATTTDNIIEYDISGASRTLTLFAAAGNTGKYLLVRITAQASTNILTITDGSFTTTMATVNEEFTIYTDGTAWRIANHYIPKTIATTASTIIGSTSNPSKGTVTLDVITWWREQNFMVGTFEYKQTAGGSAGSGTYEILVPGGWSIDTTNLVTGNVNSSDMGNAAIWSTTTTAQHGETRVFDSTHFFFRYQLDNNSRRTWGSASNFDLSISVIQISVSFKLPITNWVA